MGEVYWVDMEEEELEKKKGMTYNKLGQEFGYEGKTRIAMLLPIYINLVNFYDKISSDTGTFTNTSLEELARVSSENLRERLINKIIETK